MSFDEFLDRRFAELLRFATVLCGEPQRAHELVVEVLRRAFGSWAMIAVGRPFAVLRTGVVRQFLESGPVRSGPGDVLAGIDPACRAALVLTVYSGQTVDEVAAAMTVSLADAAAALVRARSELGARGLSSTDGSLLDALDSEADAVEVDTTAEIGSVLDALEAEPPAESMTLDPLFADSREPARPTSPAEVDPAPSIEYDEAAAPKPDEPEIAPAARDRSRVVGAPLRVAVAVVIAAVAVLVGIAVARDRHHAPVVAPPQTIAVKSTGASAAPSSPVSTGARSVTPTWTGYPVPGSVTVSEHFGSGDGVVRAEPAAAASGRQLAVDAVCSGPGSAVVGQVSIAACDGEPVGFAVTAAQLAAFPVHADPATTWRFTILDEPAHGTDATLRYPADPVLAASSPVDTLARASGSGNGSVRLDPGTTSARVASVRLVLTCTGSGVSFASPDLQFDPLYTRTCFAGWSYEFAVDAALVPEMLTVQAASGTSWHLTVVRA